LIHGELSEALPAAASKERAKIHDLVLEGIGLALRKRGYPAMERPEGERQDRDLVKRPPELLDAFNKRGSRQGTLSGCTPPFDSGFGHPCLRVVMREQLRLALGQSLHFGF
jgi:hypothetical protein